LDWLLLTKRIGNAHAMLNEACRKVLGNSVCGWSDNPLKSGPILENVWIGATIVNQHEADRDIPKLLAVPAAKRFLSMEPLLGPVDLTALLHYPCPNLHLAVMDLETGSYECCKACDYTGIGEEIGIDWVIVGGESGPGARPMHPRWVQSLRDQCQAAGVSFFFKQWGEWQPRDHATTGADPEQEQAYLRADATEPGQLLSGDCMQFSRIGKKAAGRTLDGRTWDEVPL
jgi:protein gp37